MHSLHKLRDAFQFAIFVVVFECPIRHIILELSLILEFSILIFLPDTLLFPVLVRKVNPVLRKQHKRNHQTANYGEYSFHIEMIEKTVQFIPPL